MKAYEKPARRDDPLPEGEAPGEASTRSRSCLHPQLPAAVSSRRGPGGFMNNPDSTTPTGMGYTIPTTGTRKAPTSTSAAAIETLRPILGHEGIPGAIPASCRSPKHLQEEIRRSTADGVFTKAGDLTPRGDVTRTGSTPEGASGAG